MTSRFKLNCAKNLPLKLKGGYEWAVRNTDATWFVKTDDDSVLRISTLEYYLRSTYATLANGPVGIGFICENCTAPFMGKWEDFEYRYDAKMAEAFSDWERNESSRPNGLEWWENRPPSWSLLKSRQYPLFPIGSYGQLCKF